MMASGLAIASGSWLEAGLRRLPRPWHPPSGSGARRSLSRWLLASGRRAAALHWSEERDPIVLSALGLHLTVCERWADEPSVTGDPAAALARIASLVAVGETDAALTAGERLLTRSPNQRTALARALVALADRRVLPYLSDLPLLQASLLLALDDPDASSRLLAADASPPARLIASSAARRLGRPEAAQASLDAVFDAQGLRRVTVDPSLAGIHALGCAGRPHEDGPLVSIVMPVRNVAGLLGVALASVLAQDHARLEVLVVDDASDDDTATVGRAAAQQDARVRVLALERRGGAYRARNHGLLAARGDLVTFHDGDDWSHPEKISRQLAALCARPQAVACLSDWVRTLDDGSFVARQVHPLVRMNLSSLMLRREAVLSRAGVFDAVTAGADSEYPARLALLFGPEAVTRERRLLSFASTRADSLMHAPETGYASSGGLHQRLGYWEAWNRWHARVYGRGRLADLRLDGCGRPFDVPPGL